MPGILCSTGPSPWHSRMGSRSPAATGNPGLRARHAVLRSTKRWAAAQRPLRRAQLNMLAQLVVQRVPSAHFIDLDPLTCDEEVGFRKIGRKRYTSTGCTGHPSRGRAVWAQLMQRWRKDGLMDAAKP